MIDLKGQIKNKARELGFAAVGIALPSPLELAEEAIAERVASGLLRDYGFATKPVESFTRPADLLPGAKSIIAVALPYSVAETSLHIARFAKGRDYHLEVGERLTQLGEWLREQAPGATYRICVDTGPIIDRAVAREAGIGSYGKNTAIITREAGSWVVLGEMITNVELEPDDPAPMEECGECCVCMRACPSGAIVAPFVIDQTRCISHVTQMKGSIPVELRPLVGGRIYGCDVCQEVCPKNAGHAVGPRNPSLDADLTSLLNISQRDFDRMIGSTAIAWIGRSRFRRNVAVALGNTGDPRAIPELEMAASDADPVVTEHATWAFDRVEHTFDRVRDASHPDKNDEDL